MKPETYLFFNGNCEAAFKFYEKCLVGKITVMLPHVGSPAEAHVPPEWGSKILYASLVLGDGYRLMASDAPPGSFAPPQGFAVSLHVDNPEEAQSIFKALSENATVTMPMEETFFALCFGMLTDQFGIPWMVNCEKDYPPEA